MRGLDQLRDPAADAKRNIIKRRKVQCWVIPPGKDVFASCKRRCDAQRPLVCMDRQQVHLVKKTRDPLPATTEQPDRVDCVCERAGIPTVFLVYKPLSGWREATARKRRTETDRAQEAAAVMQRRYAGCERVTPVLDSVNIRPMGAFCKTFEPSRARGLM